MSKILKFISTILIVIGLTLALLNFISIESSAKYQIGTEDEDGNCVGDPLDCY